MSGSPSHANRSTQNQANLPSERGPRQETGVTAAAPRRHNRTHGPCCRTRDPVPSLRLHRRTRGPATPRRRSLGQCRSLHETCPPGRHRDTVGLGLRVPVLPTRTQPVLTTGNRGFYGRLWEILHSFAVPGDGAIRPRPLACTDGPVRTDCQLDRIRGGPHLRGSLEILPLVRWPRISSFITHTGLDAAHS